MVLLLKVDGLNFVHR